jgi:hypothetical protein
LKPTADHPFSTWVWYVAAGADRGERQARLAECPEDKRETVKEKVKWMFEERMKAISAGGMREQPADNTHHDTGDRDR